MKQDLKRKMSVRSKVRAWCFYTVVGYVAVTVTVVGLTQDDLAQVVGLSNVLALHPMYLARMFGALCGTLLGGILCDLVPIKQLMASCIICSATSVALVPHVARAGMHALLAVFVCIGASGSALVCCATTAACWAFPRDQVGPILSGCAAAFGVTSTLLPLLLAPVRGSANLEYFVAAACGVPALMLLFVFEAPEKRQAEAPASGSDASAANSGSLGVWLLAVIACMAQALLQGSNSALIQYLVTFGQRQIHLPRNSASMLVTLLQGGVMCGSLLAARFQAQFSLLNLACVQLFLVCSLVASWIAHAHVSKLAFVVVALYGVVSGPTLGYNNALFNTYTKPTGKQMAVINLGTNGGVGLAPYVAGSLMQSYGNLTLLWMVLCANFTVFLGTSILWLVVRWFSGGAAARDTRLGDPLLTNDGA